MFDGLHTGMGAGAWVLMSVSWTGLLALAVWAIWRTAPSRDAEPTVKSPASTPEGPLELLDRRLASGAIDVKTYDELRSRLTSQTTAGLG
jgi:putative membrane protein